MKADYPPGQVTARIDTSAGQSYFNHNGIESNVSSSNSLTPLVQNKGHSMMKRSLEALAREQLEKATSATSGRAAHTVYGGHEHVLRQTLIALTAGQELSEHENPGEATVQVLFGRVQLRAGPDSWEGRRGDLLIVPQLPHSLESIEDSVVLMTVAKLP